MDKHQPTFKALSDPTRRAILELLAEQSMTIARVCEHFDITRAAVKKHLVILEEAGFIQVETKGRERVNSFDPRGMTVVRDWLSFFDAFWDERLDALKTAIEKDQT